ncbi:DEAD/DEAH box helicase [Sanyastnella coralliicola]|uniref:DEAD/DEAH box helicase n=1 Tax=Sanyastnella coralliicola TaxID=3069118 RepID=UPI0027BA351D|nr:DEAD/DEAH box helicase [Longitalea sp. SCSIO 12813]
MSSFDHLGLSEPSLRAIREIGFEKPSEIQAKAIPELISGFTDLIGLAQTGTGKTAAFGLPMLEHIDPSKRYTQALILAPTRELGQQIAEQIKLFGKYREKINILCVYGGASIVPQLKALERPQHVIIATPGRLIDLIQRKAVKLGQLRIMVLDEADEMLNMGFKEDLDRILSYTPEEKLTWLFSATMSKEIRRIVQEYMEDPMEIKVSQKNEVNKNIDHRFVVVRMSDKLEALKRFMDVTPDMRGIVFCRTKRDTQNTSDELFKKGYRADSLHGDLSQHQRDRVMRRFKNHDLQVLVATDVAARGIDVSDLTHVFHYSLPDDSAFYTHRSGRTARAGKKGTSISFVGGRDKHRIDRLSRDLKIRFREISIPTAELIQEIRVEEWARKIEQQRVSPLLDDQLFNKARGILKDMGKDELIARLLTREVERLEIDLSLDAATTKGRFRDSDEEPRWRKKGPKGYNKRNGGRKEFKHGRKKSSYGKKKGKRR